MWQITLIMIPMHPGVHFKGRGAWHQIYLEELGKQPVQSVVLIFTQYSALLTVRGVEGRITDVEDTRS